MYKPWKKEPQNYTWIDVRTNFVCCWKREPRFGFLIGYVLVQDSNNLLPSDIESLKQFKVHGGISFLHEVGDKMTFGFHCALPSDYLPYKINNSPNSIYRDRHFVEEECQKLALQIHKLLTLQIPEIKLLT